MMGGWQQFLLAIFLVAVFPAASLAEEAPSGIDPSSIIEQFEVFNDGDLLLVPVKAFGRTRMFALDTGCSGTVYDISMQRFLGPAIKSVSASTPSGTVSVSLFDSPRTHLGSISLHTDSPVVCHDLTFVNQSLSLTPVEGFVGLPTLKQFIVHLNYDTGRLLFLKAVPRNAGAAIQMSQWRGLPTVQVEIEGHGSEEFAIDTGAVAEIAGSLNAHLADVLESKGVARASKIYKAAGVDLSGDSQSKSLRIKGLRLGVHEMHDVPMSDEKGEGPSVLGMGFWSRFNVTFDFPGNVLYLQKCKHFDRPFKGSLGGILFIRKYADVVVQKVRPGGPADKSGIKPNDLLLKVGRHEAKSTRPFVLYQEFGVPETTVHVKLKRGDEIFNVDVELPEAERVTRFEVNTAADAERTAETAEGTQR